MGGRWSKEGEGRRSFRSAESVRGRGERAAYSQPNSATGQKRKRDQRFSLISDNYNSLEQVTEALASAGLESSNLIVGIDFTKSNEWMGKRSFHNRSLHHISDVRNPYEEAISIIGQTLSKFDEDNLIQCYGFGDVTTHDQDVFNFFEDGRPCVGFTEALSRYKEIVPHLELSGPTSFAPIIEKAMTIVEQSGGLYHILLIIADGQVTESFDTQSGHLSPQEHKTFNAIVKASEFPLSIVLVGVGDGPWDKMKEFDDNIPARSFDNFQFVNFTEIMSKNLNHKRKETEFALAALMEIPSQFKATMELGLLSNSARSPRRVALPPPFPVHESSPSSSTPFASTASRDSRVCPVCLTNSKNLAFGCGHQTCCNCGQNLTSCPICRNEVTEVVASASLESSVLLLVLISQRAISGWLQHMIKMFSTSLRMGGHALGLERPYLDTEKSFHIWNWADIFYD